MVVCLPHTNLLLLVYGGSQSMPGVDHSAFTLEPGCCEHALQGPIDPTVSSCDQFAQSKYSFVKSFCNLTSLFSQLVLKSML